MKASVQGSRVVTYTDASAKDPAAVIDAKLRAEANQIGVELQLTGSCSPIDPVYLHVENSTTLGALQLTASVPDSAVQTRTSGNMKGRSAGTGSFGWWDTQEGVPGYEGVIPTGSAVTVTLWMKKTSSWGTVFPHATMKLNDAFGAFFCEVTGTTPLSTTLNPYTFSCTTTEPITMFSPDRLVVFPGYSMTSGPGNHNMEIQMQLEGTSDSRFIMPNPR